MNVLFLDGPLPTQDTEARAGVSAAPLGDPHQADPTAGTDPQGEAEAHVSRSSFMHYNSPDPGRKRIYQNSNRELISNRSEFERTG